MATMAALVLVLLSSVWLVDADAFLSRTVVSDDVRQFLANLDPVRVRRVQEDFRFMYAALPKNEHGNLEPPTARYALHRYFVQEYGWFVRGLDRSSGVVSSSLAAATILKERAPEYILSLLEGRLHGQGLSLQDISSFATALSDLIHAEEVGQLEWIFQVLGLPSTGLVPAEDMTEALNTFLVAYLSSEDGRRVGSRSQFQEQESVLQSVYPNFGATQMWLDDLRLTYGWAQVSHRNPFVEHVASLEEAVGIAHELGHSFGAFQNLECHELKRKLTELEHEGTGRVLMSSFYSKALNGTWEFSESLGYLRNQGALDERNVDRPSLIIANYMNSQANCLTASNFYGICCVNECEGLMGSLERKIAAPRALPAQIAEAVSLLQSDTVHAPRNLSLGLTSRLDEIAQFHGGQVPLHGRLFAQWMHHAYPRECVIPDVKGSQVPVSPEEWVSQTGVAELDKDEMEFHAVQHREPLLMPLEIPWMLAEDLMSDDLHDARVKASPQRLLSTFMLVGVACAALVSFAMSLATAARPVRAKGKVETHFV